jgi:hypothetical protein
VAEKNSILPNSLAILGGKKVNRGKRECNEQCKYFKFHGQRYRTKHLNSRVEAARNKGDEEAEKHIIQIIASGKDPDNHLYPK